MGLVPLSITAIFLYQAIDGLTAMKNPASLEDYGRALLVVPGFLPEDSLVKTGFKRVQNNEGIIP